MRDRRDPARPGHAHEPPPPPGQLADLLKERVYLTFTTLAVVLTMRSHHEEAGTALTTIAITAAGTLLAVLVADVVSHIAAHEGLPSEPELRHMVRVSAGAVGVIVLPLVFLGLAVVELWETDTALRASVVVLVATLVGVGYLAVRRARIPAWQRVVVLFAEFLLGVVVVGLELLAHG